MKVVRSRPESNYTCVLNEVIRDGRLSRLARSILIELLSNVSGWPHATADKMWERARQERGDRAEGRLSYHRAFRELVEFGYLTRDLARRGNGLVTLLTVYDRPRPRHDGSGMSAPRRSGPHRSNTQNPSARKNGGEAGPSEPETSTPEEAPAKRRDGVWELLARIPDRLLLSPEADRLTLGRRAESLLRAGLGTDQLRALFSGLEGLGRPFGALLLRTADLKSALAFLDGKLGRGVHRPWGSTTAWPEPDQGFGAGPTGPDLSEAAQGDQLDSPPEFSVDVNGAADRTCPEHLSVRNVPGGCCALCGGPCRNAPGELVHPLADPARPGPGPVLDRSLQMSAGLVPAPRSGESAPKPGEGTDRAATEEELDPERMERMLRSLERGRHHPARGGPGEGVVPGWAGGWRQPGVARAGADRARQALARVQVTTGGGPGGG